MGGGRIEYIGLAVGRDGDMVIGEPERLDVAAKVLPVGGDEDDLGFELVAAPPPQQVEQAVVVARGEDRGRKIIVLKGGDEGERHAFIAADMAAAMREDIERA